MASRGLRSSFGWGVVSLALLAATFTYQGHMYGLTPVSTWLDAEAYAVSQGGHLVTINDVDENEFIRTTFLTVSGQQEDFWIGYYSPQGPSYDPATYEWVSGEPVTYVNWRPGQPDQANDNYGVINYPLNSSGYWDNYPGHWQRRGIYEVVPEPVTMALLALGGLGIVRRRRNV